MKADILIKNGKIVMSSGVFNGCIAVKEEKIMGIYDSDEKIQSEIVINAADKLVFPGVIDSHVHFNEPGREEWEGFETGSKSASAGGITTFIDMPLNSTPCTLNDEELKKKISIGEQKSYVDFALWGGATPDNIEHLYNLNNGGVAAFKSFLCYSGIDEYKSIKEGDLIEILMKLQVFKNVLGLHTESDPLAEYMTKKLQKMGRTDRKAYLESRSPIVEEEAVKRVLFILQKLKLQGRLHFVHISLAENIKNITEAKLLGINVTLETCPHYLALTDNDFIKIGPAAKCAPPLRSEKEVELLWNFVKKGWVDVIGSDHSPSTIELKERGNEDIWKAWGGISGIQTMFSIIFYEGVIKRDLSLPLMVKMMSYNPSKIFGLYPKKGAFIPGADADIVIFDPEKEWVIKKEDMFYKNKQTPFDGKKIKGKVEKTIVRGKIVYDAGELKEKPGYGKYQPRVSTI